MVQFSFFFVGKLQDENGENLSTIFHCKNITQDQDYQRSTLGVTYKFPSYIRNVRLKNVYYVNYFDNGKLHYE